jgi:energy-coupling factor transport system permease protein
MIHSLAWVMWLAAALSAVSATRNPLHLFLLLLVLMLVTTAASTSSATGLRSGEPEGVRSPVAVLPFTLVIVLSAGAFNVLTSHYGKTVLFAIPGRVPLLSGPLTLEALVYGATNGLALSAILIAFTILGQALPVRSLIRMIPNAFYPVALMVSIAVTFLPTLLRRLEEIREAQAIRGHQLSGLKDWPPLFLPLLVDSLERALQLAEAMTARNFIQENPRAFSGKRRVVFLSGLGLFVCGLALPFFGAQRFAFAPVTLGAGAIGGWLWWAGRPQRRSDYRKERWTAQSWVVAAGAALTLAAFFLLPESRSLLSYNPYPQFALPGFAPLAGAGSFGLLAPIFFIQKHRL